MGGHSPDEEAVSMVETLWRCSIVRSKGVTSDKEYTVSAEIMRSNGGISCVGPSTAGTVQLVGLFVADAMAVSSCHIQSSGGTCQSRVRTWMVPLPAGRFGRLSAIFCDKTESMTSGKSVATTSQPMEHMAKFMHESNIRS